MTASTFLRRAALGAAATLVLGGSILPGPALSQSASSPVVVELYTSQGCSSCPPADEFLAELVEREDVIALSFHVDYWDYLGWKDSFGDPANTERQRAYGQALGARSIYTPQMVVQGANGLVGSQRKAVEMAMMGRAEQPLPAAVSLERKGATLTIEIAPVEGAPATSGEIWLFGYDGPLTQDIERGELTGESLTYHNVVLTRRSLGEWRGGAVSLSETIDPDLKGYAVLVQPSGVGPMIGAAKVEHDSGA